MHAVILAAGFGTRLGEIAEKTAKSLLRMGQGTLLDKLVTSLWVEGIDKIHIVHNGTFRHQFRVWKKGLRWIVQPGKREDPPYLKLHNDEVTDVEQRQGAVGDLEFVVRAMNKPGDLLVVCGDNLFPPVKLEKLRGDSPAITVRRKLDVEHHEELGKVHIETGLVQSIDSGDSQPGWVFAGPAFLDRGSVPALREYCDMFRKAEVIPDSLGEFFNRLDNVRAVKVNDMPFFDIGTEKSLNAARRFFNSRGATWRKRK